MKQEVRILLPGARVEYDDSGWLGELQFEGVWILFLICQFVNSLLDIKDETIKHKTIKSQCCKKGVIT
jgi:hypothetical protein